MAALVLVDVEALEAVEGEAEGAAQEVGVAEQAIEAAAGTLGVAFVPVADIIASSTVKE